MRRSFRSTTALAAALALMAPAALLAETPLPAKAAAAMDAASRAEMPKRAATLDQELAGGLGPDRLACAGGTPRPCPDGEALVTPKGLAVHLSRDGAIVLAPRKEQRAAQAAQQGEAPAKGARSADAAARAAAAEAPAVAGAGGEQAVEHRKGERDQARVERAQAKVEKDEAKAKARAERQAAKAARQSGGAEAVPDADALAASLARAEGVARAPLVMAQAEAPAAAPVVIPEPAPAEPAAVETAPPAAEPAPVVEAAEPQPQAEPPAAEPPAAEPALRAGRSEPLPAPEPQGSPAVEEPPTLSERSDPLPEPLPDPAIAEPPLVTERAEPIPKPRPEPVVAEPAPVTGQAQPIPEPQAAPEPVVVEPPSSPAERPARPAAQPGSAPVVAQPQKGAQPQAEDAGTPDTAALAAALAVAAGGKAPVVAPAETAAAATAAVTGQDVAPTPIEVDEAATRSLEETLQQAARARVPAGTQGRADARRAAPEPVAAGATAANAAAAAAAAGSPPVAEALDAPATIGKDATAVVVTEGSARSASEDFATRLTEGLTQEQLLRFRQLQQQLGAQGQGGQPVVVDGDGGSEASRDDDDNTERDLARMLLAGVGGYVLANVLANNGQIALSSPDRVVVQQPDGTQTVIKDDNALLLQPGAQVTTENFADGSSRSIVTREDGSRVVTIRDANLRVLRRTLIAADGTVTELIDDAAPVDPVVVADLPPPARPVEMSGAVNEDALRAALAGEAAVDRRFTLAQIRNIPEVRGLVAPIEIDAITFDTGSAAIRPDQAQQLATLGKVISDYVRANPGEVFLIEGHTDTVGGAAMNLALSDRRAESVALALSQYFGVPPENMVVQGYGEQYLKVNQEGDVRTNRRASVRRITDLLARS